MEISITEEQDHLINLALNSSLPLIYEAGNLLPTLFLHVGDEVEYFSFEIESLDAIRRSCAEKIRTSEKEVFAYALIFDSTVEVDGQEFDAIFIESCDQEDSEAIELAVRYDRDEQAHGDRQFAGHVESLFSSQA